jgi:ribosomal protein L11 methyltransferase
MELSILAGSNEVASIDAIMSNYGHGGTVIEEVPPATGRRRFLIKAYLLQNRSYRAQRLQIQQDLSETGLLTSALMERKLEPDEWLNSLKSHFSTAEIGDWLVVKPSWSEKEIPASGRTVIELDPGAAFGTGLHPTTRLCLQGLKENLAPGMSVLDLGTGSGIISIAAEKLGAADILALDIDAVAVSAAKNNIACNCASNAIQVRRGTLSQSARTRYKNYFDLVIANITARAISDLAEAFFKVLKPGGKLIVSGIHDEGLDEVLISLALADFGLEKVEDENGWHAVVANKSKINRQKSKLGNKEKK